MLTGCILNIEGLDACSVECFPVTIYLGGVDTYSNV
jgi:hypothetical protein